MSTATDETRLQDAHDDAAALERAFRAFRESLAAEFNVCGHPEGAIDTDGPAPLCTSCGRFTGKLIPADDTEGQ